MILSIWRYSHFTLAIFSFSFLLVLSLTGIILAVEPIVESFESKKYSNEDTIYLMDVLNKLNTEYNEVYTLENDAYNRITVSIVNKNGQQESIYINPITGIKNGVPKQRRAVFTFAANLHRSLFLKSIGRIIVGVVSFFLFLIGVTGAALLIKRQKRWFEFFTKIIKDGSFSYYHSYVGRLTLIPILLIALSGVFLSMERFSLFPVFLDKQKNEKPVGLNNQVSNRKIDNVFEHISLSSVKSIEFPFSDSKEDYYIVKLKNKELYINQYSGEIIDAFSQNNFGAIYDFSFYLHTGKGNIVWPLVLLACSFSMLFFMYSGIRIYVERRKNKKTFVNKFNKNEAKVLILVGSETGNTHKFAVLLYNAFLKSTKKIYLDTLNNYARYDTIEHIIVMTSTYGDGIAPNSASQFLSKLKKFPIQKRIGYSVLGFGSKVYPKYCSYGELIDTQLNEYENLIRVLPLYKVNEQCYSTFRSWCIDLGKVLNIELDIKEELEKEKTGFEVTWKSELNSDDTFLLRLKPMETIRFNSGDLLGIQFSEKQVSVRYYSIAKIGSEIHLSIKRHALGVCSSYLSNVTIGSIIGGVIKENKHFNFPKKAKKVLLIANGTGIAPFLGMLNEIEKNQQVEIILGLRSYSSYNLYQNHIEKAEKLHVLKKIDIAYSKEEQNYVQDIIRNKQEFILKLLEDNGYIMICGSLKMKDEIMEILDAYLLPKINKSTALFENSGQIKIDCY
jgi:sulfite reductase (NADPH) flavoprotein alpha-component